MAKEKTAGRGHYHDVVTRLQSIVEVLEKGELPLEDSLEQFAEGISLVKQGEQLLSRAEKRIEQLMSDDGKNEVRPLSEGVEVAPPAAVAPKASRRVSEANQASDDDVPF